MRHLLFLLLSLLTFASLFTACLDEEISHSPSDQPILSSNHLSFDTIFSSFTSSTQTLKIFNRNDHAITIDNIQLLKGSYTPFKLNVNGRQTGNQSFSNITLNSDDSLYVFVQTTPNATGSSQPVAYSDSILLSCNGMTHYVKLYAASQDVICLSNLIVTSDSTLTKDKPYLVFGTLDIKDGATLTINPGVRFYFHHNAVIKVHGAIHMNGTLAQPIELSGDRTDKIFSSTPYDSLANQWDGIEIYGKGPHVFNHVNMHSGEHAIDAYNDTTFTPSIIVSNCRIHNFGGYGLVGQNTDFKVSNTIISNCGISAIYLLGGSIVATHCTLASYSQHRTGKTIHLADQIDGRACPIFTSNFSNCAILGSSNSDETQLSLTTTAPSVIAFNHCIQSSDIPTTLSSESIFVNTRFYPFDFSPTVNSPLINVADATAASAYPTDYFGNNRLQDGLPDVGAIEYIP